MKLYLLRHAETNANAERIIQGWLDTELNDRGVAQAIAAANSFNETVDAIYTSDLKRAVDTAKEFRRLLADAPYFEDKRLRERRFGDAEGGPHHEDEWLRFWSADNELTLPNMETIAEFTQRVSDFLDDLKTKPYVSVLVVTHGGVLNVVQSIIDPAYKHTHHSNAGILEIEL